MTVLIIGGTGFIGRRQATGDAKLEPDGKTDKVEGKVQNAVAGLKDTLKK